MLQFMRWQRLLPYVLLLVVPAIAIYPLWFGSFYAVGDMRDVTIPLEIFFHEQLLQGRLPSWQPDIAWGFPVIASAQIGFFYPPLLIGSLFPVWLNLPFMVAAHTVALLVGMWLYLRRRVSESAALFGSISFGLSAFVWQHVTHLNIFLSIAWLPWQLLVATWLARQVRWQAKHICAMALMIALPFLIGQLQMPFLQALFIFCYLLSRRTGRTLAQVTGGIVLIGVLVSLLAAVQVAPTLELLMESSRGVTGDFDTVRANQHSFPLYHLPTLLFPRFFGADSTYWGKRLEIEYGIFVGTLPLLLGTGYAWQLLRRKVVAPQARFWLVAAGISFLFSLGSLSPIRLLGLEPSLWVFSAPARWLLFTSLSLSVLAAHGFDWAFKQRVWAQYYLKIVLGLLTTLVVLANVVLHYVDRLLPVLITQVMVRAPHLMAGRDTAYYQEKLLTLIQSLRATSVSWQNWYTFLPLAAAFAGIVALRRNRPGVLLAATALELLLVVSTLTPTVSWREILSVPSTYYALPANVQAKQARIMSLQPEGDTGAWFTNPGSRPDTATRAQQRRLLLPLLSAQYGVAGIHWPASLDIQAQALALEALQGESPEQLNVSLAVLRTVGAIVAPRNLAVPPGAIATTYQEELAVYSLPAAHRAQLLTEDGAKSEAEYVAVSPTHTRVQVTSACDCPLVVRDTWFPGWVAFVDGKVAPIERAEDIFRQVSLTPGKHTVDFYYRPYWLYVGLLLSGITSVGCLFFLRNNRDRLSV